MPSAGVFTEVKYVQNEQHSDEGGWATEQAERRSEDVRERTGLLVHRTSNPESVSDDPATNPSQSSHA